VRPVGGAADEGSDASGELPATPVTAGELAGADDLRAAA